MHKRNIFYIILSIFSLTFPILAGHAADGDLKSIDQFTQSDDSPEVAFTASGVRVALSNPESSYYEKIKATKNGDLLWSRDDIEARLWPVGLIAANDKVIAGVNSLKAFDASTGATIWNNSSQLAGNIQKVAVAPDGSIVAARLKNITIHDPDNGSIKTKIPAPDYEWDSDLSLVVGKGGNIYISTTENGVRAYDLNGNNLWTRFDGGHAGENELKATGDEGVYYAAQLDPIDSRNGNAIYRFDSDGNKKWSYKANNYSDIHIAVGPQKRLYAYNRGNPAILYALSNKGNKLWAHKPSHTEVPGVDSNYYLDYYHHVPVISKTGRIFTIISATVEAGYPGDEDVVIQALDPDGTKAWQTVIGREVRAIDLLINPNSEDLIMSGTATGTFNNYRYRFKNSTGGVLESGWPVEDGSLTRKRQASGGGGATTNEPPSAASLKVEKNDLKTKINTSKPVVNWSYNDPDEDKQGAFRVQFARTSDFSTILRDSGKTSSADKTWTVSDKLVKSGDWHVRVKVWDEKGAESDWVSGQFFFNQPPASPINITANAQGLNTIINDPAPTLGWTHNDPNNDDQAAYEIEVAELGDFSNPDRGATATSSKKAWDLGPELTRDGRYHVRVRTDDRYDYPSGWGVFSDDSAYFTLNAEVFDISGLAADPATFNPDVGETTNVSYTLSESARINAVVRDADGIVIKTLATDTLQKAGTRSIAWDGTDKNGNLVGNGDYTVEVSGADVAVGDQDTETALTTVNYNKAAITGIKNKPDPFYNRNGTTISFTVDGSPSKRDKVGVEVYDVNGNLVKTIEDGQGKPANSTNRVEFTWDGTNDQGQVVPDGPYYFRIEGGQGNNEAAPAREGVVKAFSNSNNVEASADKTRMEVNYGNNESASISTDSSKDVRLKLAEQDGSEVLDTVYNIDGSVQDVATLELAYDPGTYSSDNLVLKHYVESEDRWVKLPTLHDPAYATKGNNDERPHLLANTESFSPFAGADQLTVEQVDATADVKPEVLKKNGGTVKVVLTGVDGSKLADVQPESVTLNGQPAKHYKETKKAVNFFFDRSKLVFNKSSVTSLTVHGELTNGTVFETDVIVAVDNKK